MGSNDPAALTQADTGRTITLKAGDSVKIQLLNAWLWGEPTVDGGAVTATRVDYLVDPGFTEWTVTAEHSGTATVSVPGTPNCGDNSVCQPRTVTFEFDVTS